MQFFKDLGHSASNLVHRRTDEEEEDPEYLKVGGWVGGSVEEREGVLQGTVVREGDVWWSM